MWVPSSLSEANEAGVLDAVALGGRGRKNDAFGQLLFRLELNFVVGPGQHPDPLGGVLIFLRHSIRQPELFGLDTGAKFFQCERLPESVHDPAREFAGQSEFAEFPPEQRLFVQGIWDLARLGKETGGGYIPRSADRDG